MMEITVSMKKLLYFLIEIAVSNESKFLMGT